MIKKQSKKTIKKAIKKSDKKILKIPISKQKRTNELIVCASPTIRFNGNPEEGIEGLAYKFIIVEDRDPNGKLKYIIKLKNEFPYKTIEKLVQNEFYRNSVSSDQEFRYLIDAQFEMDMLYASSLKTAESWNI
jgi:hypothetical protein